MLCICFFFCNDFSESLPLIRVWDLLKKKKKKNHKDLSLNDSKILIVSSVLS